MISEREIDLKTIIYTVFKGWKMMLLVFIIFFVSGCSFFFLSSKITTSSTTVNGSNSTGAKVDASLVEQYEKEKNLIAEKRKVIADSEYMRLDTNSMRQRICLYTIKWKETETIAYENKSASLYTLIAASFPSPELVETIENKDDKYKGKSLQELMSLGRTGNVISLYISYSDDWYVGDLETVFEEIIKVNEERYKAQVGDYELLFFQKTDRAVNGEAYAKNIDQKKTAISNYDKLIKDYNAKINSSTGNAVESGIKNGTFGIKELLISLALGVLVTLVAGNFVYLHGRKVIVPSDITCQLSQNVLSVIGQKNERVFDKIYYSNNDMYYNPGIYLSVFGKRQVEAGVNKINIINLTNEEQDILLGNISGFIDNMELEIVPEDRMNDFHLGMKADEVIVIAAKACVTRKRDIAMIGERFASSDTNYGGVIFEV